MLAQRYIELARTPISPEAKTGTDVRYSAEFEAIEDELAKSVSLHAQDVDWNKVRENSETLLGSHSKDLRATLWLTWSLYQAEGLPGLEAGCAALATLCDTWWEQLHPTKSRTRIAALNWFAPRLEQALGSLNNITDSQREQLKQVQQHIQALAELLEQHFAEQAPDLSTALRTLKQLLQEAPAKPPAATAETAAQITPIRPDLPTNITSKTVITDQRQAHKALRALQEQSRPLCQWWLHANSGDIKALRLNRCLAWLTLDSLPGHDAEGQTSLRGVPADKLNQYRERLQQGQHSGLLADLEASLGKSPFWLDGQYMVWQCLQGMQLNAAAEEITQQLAALLQRLPGLEKLRFFDGSPFADQQTQDWINQQVLCSRASQDVPTLPIGESTSSTAWDDGLHAALLTLRESGFAEAISQLAASTREQTAGRDRCHWQLAQARLCLHARQHSLAQAQLEALYQQLQQQGLDQWEPQLMTEVVACLYQCCDLQANTAELQNRKRELYQVLCHLDLERALQLDGS
ncbi:MAG: type VI secretion system protein TssA [Pseudomonadaceae bacterium]|nr:MAG: type VI secretion system protein TssA [Pseudomonadaceae bacterium]